ncbi:RluA family pseudouridine synthase [Xanthovirga aplysinae]|uniref:RluA family pseudouridine synthase n=1 Tax=Xanthovirga aplysinae TaxID=2529853 RepID=UPI0012BC6A32|nr:RluA family pseudouridine synthase [Xanthovirga aplysinae]MTI30308.1 RluA family pseudouridine synthase [Xanthovirga aplysinae]
MLIVETHIVEKTSKAERFLDYTIGLFHQLPSRNSVKKALKRGELLLNGNKGESGKWVMPGDKIELVDNQLNPPKTYRLPLDVVYEDEYLAIVQKPSGLIVNGNQFRTLENALPANLQPSTQKDVLNRPKPVHRLDSPTCGLLLVAKTKSTHIHLGGQFEKRSIKKNYNAIVVGKPPVKGRITTPIEGQEAITEYTVLQSVSSLQNGVVSLLELSPHTGRTHQLRIHLASLGSPIVGDKLYGEKEKILKHKGLFLAAVGLRFIHPVFKKEIHIQTDAPEKFQSFLKRENKRWLKFKEC